MSATPGADSRSEADIKSTDPQLPSSGLEEESKVHLRECLDEAQELKEEGTDYFKAEQWTQALASYKSALGRLPKRRIVEPKASQSDSEAEQTDEVDEVNDKEKQKEEEATSGPELEPLTGMQLECAQARAILNANIGACHVKLEEYKEAVIACTEALADNPSYAKALLRRATCSEKINTWSSLVSAQDDYKTLLSILPPDSPQVQPARRSLNSLQPRVDAAQKKETAEVLSKLKGLGNSILGNFGLSTDNFKFDPDGKGGYSMNFVR